MLVIQILDHTEAVQNPEAAGVQVAPAVSSWSAGHPAASCSGAVLRLPQISIAWNGQDHPGAFDQLERFEGWQGDQRLGVLGRPDRDRCQTIVCTPGRV